MVSFHTNSRGDLIATFTNFEKNHVFFLGNPIFQISYLFEKVYNFSPSILRQICKIWWLETFQFRIVRTLGKT